MAFQGTYLLVDVWMIVSSFAALIGAERRGCGPPIVHSLGHRRDLAQVGGQLPRGHVFFAESVLRR